MPYNSGQRSALASAYALDVGQKNAGMESLTKRRIARDQIVDAVAMFEQERYISATTLAGAADEIVGGLLKKKGLPAGQQLCVERDEQLWNFAASKNAELAKVRPTPKEMGRHQNRSRNEFKHNDTGSGSNRKTDHDLKYTAEEMLMRAIGNYYRLYEQLPKDTVLLRWAEYHLCLFLNEKNKTQQGSGGNG